MKKTTSQRRRVTFEVHAEPGSKIYVAGTFNAWNPKKKRLSEVSPGVYTGTALIPKGTHEYKYVIDGVWCVDPACSDWAPNEFGSLNSVISIE